ncbi:phage tail tube protein [Bradyrhizobium sp. 188]|uniref:phage tail tube protein n=1 Tax=Bradyrhizobium sp. 188 TaxID=2782656 RepID=UPI001FFA033A|nr:phage tail tube protein [Bradyrhizobium sp. 188]MCK1503125.1 hypothetical protein [Bradyrhizobium sp. 188]
MSLAEGVSARVTLKEYATGVISSNSQPVSSVDPAASGGQILRRVSSTLKLGKDTYTSNEVASHRQITDFRHGVKRVTGGPVAGEFSPGTYWKPFGAVLRATAAVAVAGTPTDFTSVSADNTTSKFTFAAGDPVAKGFRIGSIMRFTGMSDTDNNAKNFLILAFGGTSNRQVTVFPAPDTMTADTSFTVGEVGQSVYMPSSSHVSRKFAIEHYFADIDIARLFTEVRFDGFNLQLPATGISTIDFTGMGRDMETYTAAAAPFFTSPTAETTTGLAAAVNGALFFQGTRVGVCTGLNIKAALNASSEGVVGQNYVPEVFLGRLNVTGQATIMLEDATFINYFKDETEVSLLSFLTSNNNPNSPAASFYLPRIKLGDADSPLQGEAGIIQTCPFQALMGTSSSNGNIATTIRIHDTEAT